MLERDYKIKIRKGWFFYLGQLERTNGIPAQEHTYRAFTRDGIIVKMRNKRRNRLVPDDGWEYDPQSRPL